MTVLTTRILYGIKSSMSIEGPKDIPKLEIEQGLDPIQEASKAFNKELFSQEYSGDRLLLTTINLQRVLLENYSDVSLPRVASMVLAQGASRAETMNDGRTASILRDVQKSIEVIELESKRIGIGFRPIYKVFDEEGNQIGIRVACKKENCGHEWLYKGKNAYATCPRCRSSISTGRRLK